MMLQVQLETLDTGVTKMTKALVDPGSQDNVISKEYVEQFGFTKKPLDVVIQPMNADGTPDQIGQITHTVDF